MNNEEKILAMLEKQGELLEKHCTTSALQRRIDALEADVAVLKMAVKTLSQKVLELEQAQ